MFIQSSQNIEGLSATTQLVMPKGYNLEDVGPEFFPTLGINDGSLALDTITKIPYYVGNNYWREILFTKFHVSHAWINDGNMQTDPTRNFIGTLDNAAFLISAGTGVLTGPGATRFTINGQIETLGNGQCAFLGEYAGINTIINTGVGNSFVGYQSGYHNTIGSYNTSMGRGASSANLAGDGNVAVGNDALADNVTSANTAVGTYSMQHNTDGICNTSMGYESMKNSRYTNNGTIIGYQACKGNGYIIPTGHNNTGIGAFVLTNTTTGYDNTVAGCNVMLNNTTGYNNTIGGCNAMKNNTTGYDNTVSGCNAMENNITGYDNTTSGYKSMFLNTSGYGNTVSGMYSLYTNTTGHNNTVSGRMAMQLNTTGYNNIAMGDSAMSNFTTGYNNIGMGVSVASNCVGTENNCIFIGATGTTSHRGVSNRIEIGTIDLHQKSFMQGIFGNAPPKDAANVEVDAYGKLGTSATSFRYMTNIGNMGTYSAPIMSFRPVVFNYTETLDEVSFGLVAEEVEGIFPDIVVHDREGLPYTVQYQNLALLLLNETIRQQTEIDIIEALQAALEALVAIHDAFLRVISGGIV